MQGGGEGERQRETGRSLSALTATTNLDFHPNGFCKTSAQNATGYKSLMQTVIYFIFFYSVGEYNKAPLLTYLKLFSRI